MPTPAKKRSRKEAGARSIRSLNDPLREKILEHAYDYIRMKVFTDETVTWLEGRSLVAGLTQIAFDWAAERLGYDPISFDPVTDTEQDLVCDLCYLDASDVPHPQGRDRLYSTRKKARDIARDVITGPEGFKFITCSESATPEVIESTAKQNREKVALLTEKSGLVFAVRALRHLFFYTLIFIFTARPCRPHSERQHVQACLDSKDDQ